MNRLLLPALVVVIATTSFLLVTGRATPALVPLTRGHDPADYGSGPVQPLTPQAHEVATLPGHQPQDYRDPTAPTEDPLVTRGRYLANQASLCIDCHTPHDPQGEPLMEQHLHGGPIPFKPTVPMPWAEVSPRIAGLVVFNEAHVRSVLTTGKRPDGSMPRPPMPPYRMNNADADAIIAYLKTLK
jgi:mono/diheme cytochrome c family protein